MLSTASLFMALAWLGHLRFKGLPFVSALLLSWLLVLPEYCLNVWALRWGYPLFTGAQMASLRLCSGVIAIALVSRFFLNETLGGRQFLGFGLMILSITLITRKPERKSSHQESQPE